MQALQVYREGFKPSAQLDRPYAMVAISVVGAETDAAAKRLFTTPQQQFTNMSRGTRGRLQPPIDDIEEFWTPMEKMRVSAMLSCAFVGTAHGIAAQLGPFIEQTGADEIMAASSLFEFDDRLRSYEVLAQAGELLDGERHA